MSKRAALIARSIGVTLALAWLAVTDSRLLVVFAFAVPFWIAIEVEMRQHRPKRGASFPSGSLLSLPSSEHRPSYPPTDHSKAA
jgi:hypothetical protein